MKNYGDKLKDMGLTELQIVTILCGWSVDGIEALLRGERTPPSQQGIVNAMSACGA
jgi:hypothetical protein